MRDEDKSREQLLEELHALRRQILRLHLPVSQNLPRVMP